MIKIVHMDTKTRITHMNMKVEELCYENEIHHQLNLSDELMSQ